MKLINEPMPGLKLLEPTIFGDDRGYFYESYNQEKFRELGIPEVFVQDNQSFSQQGVVRGLHFQAPPFAQGKLVRVLQGAVIDVAVDIRLGSPTYGQTYAIELTDENKLQFYLPPGFAHGFSTLAPNTIFSYKCTNYYNKASEGGILWNDPDLAINWEVENPILSDKDIILPELQKFKSPFTYE